MPPADFPSSSLLLPKSFAENFWRASATAATRIITRDFLRVRLPLEIPGTAHTKDNGWSNFSDNSFAENVGVEDYPTMAQINFMEVYHPPTYYYHQNYFLK